MNDTQQWTTTGARSRRRRAGVWAAGVVAVLAGSVALSPSASAQTQPCEPPPNSTAMLVTAECVDPVYNQPVIDSETDVTVQVPVHLVSGHFAGTTKRFNIYLPRGIQFDGRFFQLVYPLDDENAEDGVPPDFGPPQRIAFGAASGGYTVQTNGGGGYRVDAAAAKFAKTVAANYYGWSGPHLRLRLRGQRRLVSRRSGPSRTPWVCGTGRCHSSSGVPTSIPNNFFVRAFARFVLGAKAPQIADAVAPGGSGDPFAGLNATEQAVLAEVTKMGVPLRAWEDYRYVLGLDTADGLLGFGGTVRAIDPTYVNDFWTKPGYVGTEQSALGDLFRAARVPGDVNNDWNLALLTYHRHQVPKRPGFYAFDQFRDASGQPLYPQRPLEIGPLISASVYGGTNAQGYTHTGNIHGKVIVVDNLLDTDAFPWHADWYAAQVQAQLGDRFDDNFRVWFNDNADHLGPRTPHLVDYNGILQQALRDVSAWAEQGIAPPRSTRYEVTDSQVSVPANAAARRGIQPVVDLTVKGPGHDRVDVAAGQTVTFQAKIQVPPNTGQVVATDWDFTGTGTFVAAPLGAPKPTVHVQATFTYTTPGTYFVALRATSQRDGDTTTPFARVQNLGRIRVVVH